MTARFLYQPQDGHTVCGSFAAAQRGQTLRAGAARRHDPARWLWVFIFDFFFLGTATVGLQHLVKRSLNRSRTNGLFRQLPSSWPFS